MPRILSGVPHWLKALAESIHSEQIKPVLHGDNG
jgi:hypothetical protein